MRLSFSEHSNLNSQNYILAGVNVPSYVRSMKRRLSMNKPPASFHICVVASKQSQLEAFRLCLEKKKFIISNSLRAIRNVFKTQIPLIQNQNQMKFSYLRKNLRTSGCLQSSAFPKRLKYVLRDIQVIKFFFLPVILFSCAVNFKDKVLNVFVWLSASLHII